jgi:3-hydroxyisobutyrate dehydrogenase
MKRKIGFIGLGAMGAPMASNLLKKGFQVEVLDLKFKDDDIKYWENLGGSIGKNPAEVAAKSDVVITMLPSTPDVRKVLSGSEGVIHGVNQGAIVIDMSTIDLMPTRELAELFINKGAEMLDAPVARGVAAAKAGTLVIFVGGKRETYERCLNIFSAMGTDILYVGESGSGQIVKIVNNLIIAIEMCALAEAMVLGVKAGVDPNKLFDALSKASANSFVLQNHVKNYVLQGKFYTGVFPVDYIIKDLDLALTTATENQVPLNFGSAARQTYEWAKAAGYGDRYYPVIFRLLEKLTGVEVRENRGEV